MVRPLDDGDGDGRRPGLDALKRRLFSLPALVSLAVAGGFLLFLVTRFDVDLGLTWERIRNANPWYLAAAFAVHYTTFGFRGARWRMLLQHAGGGAGRTPGVLYCSQLVLLGWFANSIGWLRLGDAFRAYLYQDEQDATFSGTIGTILAERALDTALVVALLIITLPFLVDWNDNAAWSVAAWSVLGPAVALAVALSVVLGLMFWGRGFVSGRLPGWLASRYENFHQGTMGSFRRLPFTTALGLLGWMAEVGRMFLVVRALGLEISFPMVIFLTLANSLLSLVPTPGGVGAVESGVAGLAVRISRLTASSAAALVLVDRFITYISVIMVGAALFAGRQVFRRRMAPEQGR